MKKAAASSHGEVERRIADIGGWRAETLARVRQLVLQADPQVTEELKWKKPTNPAGVPTWSHDGIICTGEALKESVRLTFAKGAALPDPSGLFNSGKGGNVRRAIDIRQGGRVNAAAFKALVRAAVKLNTAGGSKRAGGKPKLLSGGNPQIAKGDGDAPVQAYIEAMPGWKREAGQKLDALITRAVPGVRKAVKWNSPFYGVEGQGWFLSFHVFTRYIKVAFFRGALLKPLPPEASKDPNARYVHIHEGEKVDEKQLASWITQAASIPGWNGGSPKNGGIAM